MEKRQYILMHKNVPTEIVTLNESNAFLSIKVIDKELAPYGCEDRKSI